LRKIKFDTQIISTSKLF